MHGENKLVNTVVPKVQHILKNVIHGIGAAFSKKNENRSHIAPRRSPNLV